MDFATCPSDGTRLKAREPRIPGGPLIMICPACSALFRLGGGGVVPADGG